MCAPLLRRPHVTSSSCHGEENIEAARSRRCVHGEPWMCSREHINLGEFFKNASVISWKEGVFPRGFSSLVTPPCAVVHRHADPSSSSSSSSSSASFLPAVTRASVRVRMCARTPDVYLTASLPPGSTSAWRGLNCGADAVGFVRDSLSVFPRSLASAPPLLGRAPTPNNPNLPLRDDKARSRTCGAAARRCGRSRAR